MLYSDSEHGVQAIVKSYSIPSSDESRPDEKFVGYMVPKVDEVRTPSTQKCLAKLVRNCAFIGRVYFLCVEQLDKDPYNEDEEIAYSWVREYHWDVCCHRLYCSPSYFGLLDVLVESSCLSSVPVCRFGQMMQETHTCFVLERMMFGTW